MRCIRSYDIAIWKLWAHIVNLILTTLFQPPKTKFNLEILTIPLILLTLIFRLNKSDLPY
jgi:hypothetical protein